MLTVSRGGFCRKSFIGMVSSLSATAITDPLGFTGTLLAAQFFPFRSLAELL